jgi:hypothetical protein
MLGPKIRETKAHLAEQMIRIKISDIRRATLPLRSGNEGWIGVSPRGDEYHVVVPVDVQIARGVMACNRPTDGTPFGGYSRHLYFRCPPYSDEGEDEDRARERQIAETADELVRWLASYGLEASIEDEPVAKAPAPCAGKPAHQGGEGTATGISIACSSCAGRWKGLSELLGSPHIRLEGYRACPEDFRQGRYLFSHHCGGTIEVPVSLFIRPRRAGRNLAGSHACPGMCLYEMNLSPCSAVCEGSCYRRVAGRLKSRESRAE